MILPTTAERTGGLCMPCQRRQKRIKENPEWARRIIEVEAQSGVPRTLDSYEVRLGVLTNPPHQYCASIEEFAALVGIGKTIEDAIKDLRKEYRLRVDQMNGAGEKIPLPGSGPGRVRFAPSDEVEALRPLVDEFWDRILRTSYTTSFVSNQSKLSSWESYVPGGRDEVISRVRSAYGVDITEVYDSPIPVVLRSLRAGGEAGDQVQGLSGGKSIWLWLCRLFNRWMT
jgi:hypothetical protein